MAQNPWPQHHDSFTAGCGKCGLDNGSTGSGTLGLAETAEAAVQFNCGDSPGVFSAFGLKGQPSDVVANEHGQKQEFDVKIYGI